MYGEGEQVTAQSPGDRVIDVAEVTPDVTTEADDLVIDLRSVDSPADSDCDHEPSALDAVVEPGALRGRVAVVTGGANGVGREVALGLARAGARVCVLGRDVAQLRETVEQANPGEVILYLQCDVGSVSEIEGVVDFISRFDRPVDILVHAEGVQVRGGIEHGSVNDLDEQYLVNVRGPYVMTQQLAAQLRSGHGHVVFVVPTAPATVADIGQFSVTAEAAASLADALRTEVSNAGIRVTSVRPEIPAPVDFSADVAVLSPADVAASVLHAVMLPAQVEITELRLRPRAV